MVAPIVVFDLDGTLVDTAPDLVDTLNTILSREGLPAAPFAAARAMIGGGARRMLESGLLAAGRAFMPADVDRLFQDFLAYYEAHIADRSRPFPDVEPALDRLAGEGFLLAVCTNKIERLSRRLLDSLHLLHRFSAVCGQDTFGIQKPDPELLRRTIDRAGGTLEHAVMVGDSATDIHVARGARVPVIAVDFGYTETPVAAFAPDRIIGSFAQLPEAVRALAPHASRAVT
jgi:phosphoglycolate phosphatase